METLHSKQMVFSAQMCKAQFQVNIILIYYLWNLNSKMKRNEVNALVQKESFS